MQNGKKVKAHTIYRNSKGERLISVTTALGILNKPALLYWAWDLGIQGIDFRKFRDDKAEIGTLAHEMVLAHLKGLIVDTSGYSKDQIYLAENSFEKYLNWEKEHTVQPILLEEYLVSEEFQYGGTIDNYCQLDGKLALVDYKTSKRIYDEHFFQLGAYKQLLVENGHKVDKVMILRIGRNEEEGFEVKEMFDLTKHLEVFKACLTIYRLQKELKQ